MDPLFAAVVIVTLHFIGKKTNQVTGFGGGGSFMSTRPVDILCVTPHTCAFDSFTRLSTVLTPIPSLDHNETVLQRDARSLVIVA